MNDADISRLQHLLNLHGAREFKIGDPAYHPYRAFVARVMQSVRDAND